MSNIELLSKGLIEAAKSGDPSQLRAYILSDLFDASESVQRDLLADLKERVTGLEEATKQGVDVALVGLSESVGSVVETAEQARHMQYVRNLLQLMREYGLLPEDAEEENRIREADSGGGTPGEGDDSKDAEEDLEYHSPWHERPWETAKETGSKVGDWWEQTNWNPSNWSPSTKWTAVGAVVAVSVVAAVWGIYKWGGNQVQTLKEESKNRAAQARRGTADIVVLGALALAGVLAFFGAKQIAKMVEESAIGNAFKLVDDLSKKEKEVRGQITELGKKTTQTVKQMQSEIAQAALMGGENGRQKAEELKGKMEDYIAEQRKKTEGLEGELITLGKEKAEYLKRTKKGVRKGAEDKKDATPLGTPPLREGPGEGEGLKDASVSAEATADKEDAEESEDAEEETEYKIPTKTQVVLHVLQELYDNEGIVPICVAEKAALLQLPMRSIWVDRGVDEPHETRPVTRVESSTEVGLFPSVERLIENTDSPEDRQMYRQGYDKLISLCRTMEMPYRHQFKKSGRSGMPEHVTLGQFLSDIGESMQVMMRLYEQMKLSGGDIGKMDLSDVLAAKEGVVEVDLNDPRFEQSSLAQSLKKAQESGDQEAIAHIERLQELLKRITLEQILIYIKNNISSAKNHVRNLDATPSGGDVGFCVWAIVKYGLPTASRLRPLFHEVLPNRDWDADNNVNETEIAELIQGISLAKAVRLFMFDTMTRSSEPIDIAAGITLTQAEILHLIRMKDETMWGWLKPDFYHAGEKAAFALSDPEAAEDLLDELDVESDLRQQVKMALLSSGEQGVRTGLGLAGAGLLETASSLLGTTENFSGGESAKSWTIAGAGTLVALFGVQDAIRFALRSPFIAAELSFFRNFAHPTVASLQGTQRWWQGPRGLARSLWSRIEPAASAFHRRNAGQHLSGILEKISKSGENSKALLSRYNQCLRGFKNGGDSWKLFLDEIDDVVRSIDGGSDALDHIRRFNEIPGLPDEKQALKWILEMRRDARAFALDPQYAAERYVLDARQRFFWSRVDACKRSIGTTLRALNVPLGKTPSRLALQIALFEMHTGVKFSKDLVSNRAFLALIDTGHAADALTSVQRVYAAHGIEQAKRVCHYLVELGDNTTDVMRSAAVIDEIADLGSGNARSIGKFMRKQAAVARLSAGGKKLTERACIDAIKQMSNWRKAGNVMKFFQAGGLVLEGGMVVLDVCSMMSAAEQTRKTTNMLREELTGIGFSEQTGSKENEILLVGHGLEISLFDLDDLTDAEISEYMAKAAVSTAALAGTAYMVFFSGASMGGPVGLALAGAVVAVRYGIEYTMDALQESKHRAFLQSKKCPAWLLSALSTEAVTQQSPYEVMDTFHAGLTRSELLESSTDVLAMIGSLGMGETERLGKGDEVEEGKESIRDKAFQTLCVHTFRREYPELYFEMLTLLASLGQQVVDTHSNGVLASDGWFLKQGGAYETIVKPYAALRMQAETRKMGAVSFAETAGLTIPDAQWMFPASNADTIRSVRPVTKDDLQEIALRAMVLSLFDLRQKYIERELTEAEADESPIRRAVRIAYLKDRFTRHQSRKESETGIRFSLLGMHPDSIPRIVNGKGSFVQTMIQERFGAARNAEKSGQSVAENAAEGWGIAPNDEQSMNIWSFEKRYLTPEIRSKHTESRLLGQDANLFSQYEQQADDEQMVREIHATCREMYTLVKEIEQAGTEEELKQICETDAFEHYLNFNIGFHRLYLRRWRQLSDDVLPKNIQPLVRSLAAWKKQGYPSLLPAGFLHAVKELRAPGNPTLEHASKDNDPVQSPYIYSLDAYAEAVRKGYVSTYPHQSTMGGANGSWSWAVLDWSKVKPGLTPIPPYLTDQNASEKNPFVNQFFSGDRSGAFNGFRGSDLLAFSQRQSETTLDKLAASARDRGSSVFLDTLGRATTTDELAYRRAHGEKTVVTPTELLMIQRTISVNASPELNMLRQHILRNRIQVGVDPQDPQLRLAA